MPNFRHENGTYMALSANALIYAYFLLRQVADL